MIYLILQQLLENDDEDDVKFLSSPPEHVEGVHTELFDLLVSLEVTGDRIRTRYSDVYVLCRTWEEANQIRTAGPWKSMAEIVRTNREHPDAKQFPWLVDIPFANLSGYITGKSK